MSEPASTDDNWTPLDAALHYASLGWRVLPIKPGGKRPPMASWQHAATTDTEIIRNWYKGLYGGHGVGIATGAGSGIFVLDVDVSGDKRGDETLADLEARHGKLPDTVRAITGSNGRHIAFKNPTGVEIRNNASTKLGPGLDVRGEGGQVVAAPSVHPNGTPYRWEPGHGPGEVALADAPAWLIDMLASPTVEPAKPNTYENLSRHAGTVLRDVSDSIAEHINRTHDWHGLLYADGWQQAKSAKSDETAWTRPGKDPLAGASAVLHEPDGPLVVFSTDASLSALHDPTAATKDGTGYSFSLFGYIAATRHGGDRSACARAYRVDLNTQQAQAITADRGAVAYAVLTGGEVVPDEPPRPMFVDWSTFWATDHMATEWVAEPLVAQGRGHAIFAPGGTGKSLLSLWLAARIATGGHNLTGEVMEPRRVMYLDYEMTESDLFERLEAMGYGPDADLSRLCYALFPTLPPLDTAAGGQGLMHMAKAARAEVVIIDTFIRAVEGDENDANTTAAFDRFSGRALKSQGIAWVRMDHSGKDPTKGARGSSAKNDDVDIVWQMTANEEGYSLKAVKRRMGWVPETVGIIKRDDPTLTFHTSIEAAVPAGTVTVIELLDTLGVDPHASRRQAENAVREAGQKVRTAVVAAAQKRRRLRAQRENDITVRHISGSQNREPLVPNEVGNHAGNHGNQDHITPGQPMGTTTGTTGNHPPRVNGSLVPPLIGEPGEHLVPVRPSRSLTDEDIFG